MSSYTDAIQLIFSHPQDGFSHVVTAFDYAIGDEHSDRKVHVEEGFVTDGMSVPWFLSFLFKRYGNYLKAAIVHDKLYAADYEINGVKITRKEADDILYESLLVLKCGRIRAKLAHVLLRSFGFIAWNKHRKNKGKQDTSPIPET